MFRLLFIAALTLLSSPSYAQQSCPAIDGTFNCKLGENIAFSIDYKTTENAGIKTYNMTTEGQTTTIVADGELHTIIQGPSTIEYVAFCPPQIPTLRIVSRNITEQTKGEVLVWHDGTNLMMSFVGSATYTCEPVKP